MLVRSKRRVSARIERQEGRHVFGGDPTAYDEARPDYPDRLYELLVERCGLLPGTATLEIGPATGLATRRLLALGADPVVGVEPDPRLAAFLEDATRGADARVEIVVAPFEDAELPDASFDLAVAATAFHWVEQRPGLEKLARLLRPGGWWAMWWTIFGDPERPDPFHEATHRMLESLAKSPSAGIDRTKPFALDVDARLADLASVRAFEPGSFERIPWTLTLTTDELTRLYATFSSMSRLSEVRQGPLLAGLARIAQEDFAGRVERPVVTAVYTAQRRA